MRAICWDKPGAQRYRPTQRTDKDRLTLAIAVLASQYGRCDYRRITALLVRTGWMVGKYRVERIWRSERLNFSKKQKPRGRFGSTMDSVCGSDRHIRAMCRATTSRVQRRMMPHPQPDRRVPARVSAHLRGTALVEDEGEQGAGRCHGDERNAGASSIGQRDGGRCQRSVQMACRYGRKAPVHRTNGLIGERLLQIVQLETWRGVPQRETLLLRSKNCVCWLSDGASATTLSGGIPAGI